MKNILARLVGTFAYEGMYWIAEYFLLLASRFDARNICEIHMQIARYMRCDVVSRVHDPKHPRKAEPRWVISLIREIVIQGIMLDESRITETMRAIRTSEQQQEIEPMRTIEAIARCTHPSARMTDCMECLASDDIAGYLEYLPHLKSSCGLNSDAPYYVRKAFGKIGASRIIIGPVFARLLVDRYGSMHHVAAQFPRDSPEFAEFATRFEFAIRSKWVTAWWDLEMTATRMRNKICVNLVCAARNPDARVFEWVLAKLREAQLIDRIDRVCEIAEWNCGEGSEGLRRILQRIEGAQLVVSFDNNTFWQSLRIDALPVEEAVECIDMMLARKPNLRKSQKWGAAARECFKFCVMRFGKPMLLVLAKYNIALK